MPARGYVVEISFLHLGEEDVFWGVEVEVLGRCVPRDVRTEYADGVEERLLAFLGQLAGGPINDLVISRRAKKAKDAMLPCSSAWSSV